MPAATPPTMFGRIRDYFREWRALYGFGSPNKPSRIRNTEWIEQRLESGGVDWLVRAAERGRTRRRVWRWTYVAFVTLAITTVISRVAHHQWASLFSGHTVEHIFTFSLYALWTYSLSKPELGVARALTGCTDKRGVGILAEALAASDAGLARGARDALVTILPTLGPDDLPLIRPDQRTCLYDMLRKSHGGADDPVLALAIVNGLRRIGARGDLSVLRELAEPEETKGDGAVQQAAQEWLDELEGTAERRRHQTELLRPAGAAPADTRMLVRPAGSAPADAAMLLRLGEPPMGDQEAPM